MLPDSQEPDESSYYIKPKPRPRVMELVLDQWHKLIVALSPSRSFKPDPPSLISEPRPAPMSLFNNHTPEYSRDFKFGLKVGGFSSSAPIAVCTSFRDVSSTNIQVPIAACTF